MASLMNLTVGVIGLSYTELMLIWKSDVDGAGNCVRIVLLIIYLYNSFFWFIWGSACFAYDKIVINQWFSIFFGPWTSFLKSIRWATVLCWQLTPHKQLVETCTQVSERFIIDLWNSRWVGGPPGPRWKSLS